MFHPTKIMILKLNAFFVPTYYYFLCQWNLHGTWNGRQWLIFRYKGDFKRRHQYRKVTWDDTPILYITLLLIETQISRISIMSINILQREVYYEWGFILFKHINEYKYSGAIYGSYLILLNSYFTTFSCQSFKFPTNQCM